jgi:hypothetical protein
VNAARFTGLNRDGLAFTISAATAEAIAREGSVFDVTGLDIEALGAGEILTQLTSPRGQYDAASERFETNAGITAIRSDGMSFTADRGYFVFDEGRGRFDGNVVVLWTEGTLNASWIEIDQSHVREDGNTTELYTFGGGVTLRIRPVDQVIETGED